MGHIVYPAVIIFPIKFQICQGLIVNINTQRARKQSRAFTDPTALISYQI